MKAKYEQNKEDLINDKSICKENRDWFEKFFEWEEYKLKRKRGKLDAGCYKTLIGYISRFKNINKWFKNKPGKEYTKKDIKRVYDALEDGLILNNRGKPFEDRKSYYNKIFKSKPFELIGKKEIAQKVIEFYSPKENDDVRFIREAQVRELIAQANKPTHKALMWLAFDVGENINSLLKLKKKDFFKEKNPDSKEAEYRINLRKKTLKRTRKQRNEITNYPETVQFLDIVLKDLSDEDLVFSFTYSMAKKFLDRAVKILDMRCEPNSEKVSWKDLRSSMACDLLLKDWTIDEINARLGHKPSSVEVDKYVNYLAIGRHKPKKKVVDHSILQLKDELKETKDREKLLAKRYDELQKEQQRILFALEGLKRQGKLPKK